MLFFLVSLSHISIDVGAAYRGMYQIHWPPYTPPTIHLFTSTRGDTLPEPCTSLPLLLSQPVFIILQNERTKRKRERKTILRFIIFYSVIYRFFFLPRISLNQRGRATISNRIISFGHDPPKWVTPLILLTWREIFGKLRPNWKFAAAFQFFLTVSIDIGCRLWHVIFPVLVFQISIIFLSVDEYESRGVGATNCHRWQKGIYLGVPNYWNRQGCVCAYIYRVSQN